MRKTFIIFSLIGILFSVMQYMPLLRDVFKKIELCKKTTDIEESGEDDCKDSEEEEGATEFIKLNQTFDYTINQISSFKKQSFAFAHLKGYFIYFQIITPPPEV
jgi:hypothetical protein